MYAHRLFVILAAPAPSQPNACGIHIHVGDTCNDLENLPGGHFYDASKFSSDPWINIV